MYIGDKFPSRRLKALKLKEDMTNENVKLEPTAREILAMEDRRINAINRAKNIQPIPERFITVGCVPDIKVPTFEQMMEFRYGNKIKKAKEEALEKIKKDNNIDNNQKLETL